MPRRSARYQPEHAPIKRNSVHAAPRVFAERDEAADRHADRLVPARSALPAELHGADRRLAEVAVDVTAVERAERLVAHHVATGDRAVAGGVVVHDARLHGAGRRPAAEAAPALEDVPAVVRAPPGAAAGEVDLLL